MRLKKQVQFDKNNMILKLGNHEKKINPEDDFIIQALQNHVTDDAHFLRLVMTKEHSDEIEAGFRMAAFVEEYGEFLKEEPAGIISYHKE